jgi:aerobic-type carbon monoxide dehydrogenase small subunit (CoxS/CutS family)
MKETVGFRLNGQQKTLETEGDRKLLWVLRTDLGLTGTKYGCGESFCGSCTVIVDGEAVRTCQYPVSAVQGKEVITIEGLASGKNLHPLQEEFADRGALQCGFCTPGMIMSAYGLILAKKRLTRGEIVEGMEENLCRCGAHQRIVEAIEAASRRVGS